MFFSDSSKETSKQSTVESNNNSIQNQQPKQSEGKVEIKSHSVNKTNFGWNEIVGEVINKTTKPVSFIKIIATFYDKDEKVVATDFTYANNDELQPEMTAPFEITEKSKVPFDHYKLDATWH